MYNIEFVGNFTNKDKKEISKFIKKTLKNNYVKDALELFNEYERNRDLCIVNDNNKILIIKN